MATTTYRVRQGFLDFETPSPTIAQEFALEGARVTASTGGDA